MREPTFLILSSLAAGPRHGYGIMTDVERISEGARRLRDAADIVWSGV